MAFEGVSFAYPGREDSPALRDITLTVREGEFLALVGLNGSGKSTLCRMINALLLPSAGRVLACGMDTSSGDNLAAIRGRVALVMQNPDNQIVGPTVEDDIAFGPENLGLPREEIAERVAEALHIMGLDDLRAREPHLLSEGEKKRLALAGALAMRPRVLVSDESTSMLDPRSRLHTLSLLKRLSDERGLTVVHATHHADELPAAGRVILLSSGSIAFDGTPEDFFAPGGSAGEVGMEEPPLFALARELASMGLEVSRRPLSAEEVCESLWA